MPPDLFHMPQMATRMAEQTGHRLTDRETNEPQQWRMHASGIEVDVTRQLDAPLELLVERIELGEDDVALE